MADSRCRQNFHADCEAGINKQINMELYACYTYLSIAYFFDRDDIALKGMFEYFKKASDEEREHAQKLMKYQNKRGGRIVLQPIDKPAQDTWGTALLAMEAALQLERTVNQALLDLHKVAEASADPSFMDYLEGEFLEEQVEAIKEISDHVTNLKRVGAGLGEYLFSKDMS